jgi:NAD(P)-dependent dehydrogenase (short-subunit alcohol dehydrogenase family)
MSRSADDNATDGRQSATSTWAASTCRQQRRLRYRGEIGALDVAKMKEMFDTNIFGLVDLTNRVVPQMKTRGSGDIVNIASTPA